MAYLIFDHRTFMKNEIFCLCLISSLSAGCSIVGKYNRSPEPIINKDYSFTIKENLNEKKFHLVLSGTSKFPICVTNTSWPSEIGAIDSASRSVALEIDGKKYPFKDINMGVCPAKECGIKIQNGETIESDVFYKDFAITEGDYGKSKKLILDPKPYWCDELN